MEVPLHLLLLLFPFSFFNFFLLLPLARVRLFPKVKAKLMPFKRFRQILSMIKGEFYAIIKKSKLNLDLYLYYYLYIKLNNKYKKN